MWKLNRYQGCAVGLIVLQAVLLLASASVHNPIDDELAHLPCGIMHWKTGDRTLYHVNPPLVRMVAAVPVMALYPNLAVPTFDKSTDPSDRPEFMVAYHFLQTNGNPMLCSIYFWARSVCVLFPLIGAIVCWLWSRELYGEFAGLLCILLWTTCPLVLGWGSTIYPDVPAASLGLLATYLFWRWTCRPNWNRTCWAGLALGAAMLTKLTLLYMIAVLPILWFLSGRLIHGSKQRKSGVEGQQCLAIVLMSILIVNAMYGFERTLMPLEGFGFRSELLAGKKMGQWQSSNRFQDSLLGKVPIPFPEQYVLGFDTQRREFEAVLWSYLNGKHQKGGWYHYYLFTACIKLPIGTLALFGIASLLTISQIIKRQPNAAELFLIAPAIVLMLVISSQTGINWYTRYAIPALPFFYVWTSKVASTAFLSRPAISIGIGMLAVFSAMESLSVFPHSISFFNRAIGGPSHGSEYLLDGAIDSGQDLILVKRWIDENPSKLPLRLKFAGVYRPKHLGLDVLDVPKFERDSEKSIVLPKGWYAISVNAVRGSHSVLGVDTDYCYFQQFEPIGSIGYSINLYHLDSDTTVMRRDHE